MATQQVAQAMEALAQRWDVPVLGQRLSMTAVVDALGGPGRGGGTRAAADILGVNIRSVQRYLAGERGTAKETHGANKQLLNAKLDALTNAVKANAREQVKRHVTEGGAGGVSASVSGEVQVSETTEDRSIDDVSMDVDDLDDMIDEMLDGDYSGAGDAFNDAFFDAYDFDGAEFTDIDDIDIGGDF